MMIRGLALTCLLTTTAALIAAPPVRAGAAEQTRVAVAAFPPRVESDAAISGIVARTLAAELDASGRYDVLAGGRLLQKLPADLRGRLGCFADPCLIEIGAALGADYVFGGSVDRQGPALSVEVKVLDVVAGRVVARAIEPIRSTADAVLRDSLARLSNRLFLPHERFPGAGAAVRSRGGEISGERGQVWSWVVGGTGLALSLVASSLLLVANRDFGDAEDLLDRARPPNQEGITYDQIRDLETGAQDMEKAGWVLLGVGGAALVGGVVLFILEPGAADEDDAPGPTALAPWAARQGGGVVLGGRF